MRVVSTLTGATLCTGLLMALSAPASAAVDAKLLDMLRANGSISAAQYSELSAELTKETQAKQQADAAQAQAIADVKAKKDELSSFEQKVAWASKTQIKGDLRVRYEDVRSQGNRLDNSRSADRERVRARFGVYSQINPEVDGGIRVATGSSSDGRSTNQDLNADGTTAFAKKQLWVDQAYLDWHPNALPNLHLIGGKMAQPWVSMGDIIWDGDLNPEGAAATYKVAVGQGVELFGSTGYFNLKDNVDGEGYQYKHDLSMFSGQLGTRFDLGSALKVTLGGSVYAFKNDDKDPIGSGTISRNGNTTNDFRLYEAFGQVDLKNLPIPLAFYGQYVNNQATNSDQDTGWLAGTKTRLGDWSLDYNYRDVQRNAVVGGFTDSDFANGFTGSRGHKLKVGYDISKNFGLGVTYFLAETDSLPASSTQRADNDLNVNTLQVDLEAKF
ncbi:putative porin [Pseudomonas sp. KNUC1026]|uniref:putative porin n=1 Tax=Pseudomonas sp. KNUC1026 TaxID=2893890 RepID=UPI001F2F46DF|nr:putative porin [Pseudomonas sp. KNUC1026]UFH50563.1 putative porin [Pseudomonas sp. KNUC1026]